MANWIDYDMTSTLRDYDYTRRSVRNMNRVLDSADFENMEADHIFRYLHEQMQIVHFGDYLKRYIYERAGFEEDFLSVPDEEYLEILDMSMKENRVPISLEATTTRRRPILKKWLSADTVKRPAVFILAFALRMPVEDASEFLTKVLKENDFEFLDYEEVIYWYCLRRDLPFPLAQKMINEYRAMVQATQQPEEGLISDRNFHEMQQAPSLYLIDEINLKQYLAYLHYHDMQGSKDRELYHTFMALYQQCQVIIANLYNETHMPGCPDKTWKPEHISPADLESILCSGIPRNKNGNLQKMSASLLSKHFQNMRMSRQRISQILNHKQRIQRFDLISLLFFIYAETVEPDWPTERFLQFVDKANELLIRSHMLGIYPVNPYDAFVLMCLLTEFPLDVYNEIWEMSY